MKLRTLSYTMLSAVAVMTAVSCDDNTTTIGSSLVETENEIVVADNFTLEGHSVDNNSVQSRTIMQLIGSIDAHEFGRFSSDFVTQFMSVAEIDSTLTSSAAIDSVKLLMMFAPGAFVGDSIVPMGVEVYRLNRQLKAPIFSDFNPEDYYDASAPIGSKVYVASNAELPTDSIKNLSYREIYVDLPREIGVELFDLYVNNPSAYLSPAEFCKYFPGIYVKNNYGSGRVTQIGATSLMTYYHQNTKNSAGRDTVYHYKRSFYQATPEIISNNNIRYEISPELTKRVAQGEQLIVAPAGLDIEMRFPLPEIIDYYHSNAGQLTVLNKLVMSIPVEKIANDYGIEPPEYLLMVLKGHKNEFFEKSEVTNSKTSFYAKIDRVNGRYEFSSLRAYLLDALSREGQLTEDDYTFILTPVTVDTEAHAISYSSYTEYIKSITPYVERPAMARLRLDEAKIVLTFSKQSN